MSRKTLYVIDDGLVYAGRSYARGDVIALDSAAEQQLLEEDRVSTTEPKDSAPADVGQIEGTAPSIADVPTADLIAELGGRDDYEAPTATPEPPDYDKLKVDQLEQLITDRTAALEPKGTGDGGKVVKADLVAALTAADAVSFPG